MAVFTSVDVTIIDPVQLTTSVATYYTAPGAADSYGYAEIAELSVANDTTTPMTFTLHYVPSGGAAGDDNIIVKNQELGSEEAFSITELLGKIHLEPAGTIQAIASAANQATIRIFALAWS